jgi:hypothetical protein
LDFKEQPMTSAIRSSLLGAGTGALVMFLLDPERGGRRRALIRDKFQWASRKMREAAGATRRDVGNRLAGATAGARAVFANEAADDATIAERVRTALGRVTAHDGAISVDVLDGFVTLTGDALASDASTIVSAARRTRGVEGVSNEIRVHQRADGIPALQGGTEPRSRLVAMAYTPTAAAAAAGIAGIAIAVAAGRRAIRTT